MADLHLGIITIYPELAGNTMPFTNGTIVLRDDMNGKGPYIDTWKYDKPRPSLEDIVTASTSNAALAYVAQQEELAKQMMEQIKANQRPMPAQPSNTAGTQTL